MDGKASGIRKIERELSVGRLYDDPVGSLTLLTEIVRDVDVVSINGTPTSMVKHIDRPLDEIIQHFRTGNLDEIISAYKHVATDVPTKRLLDESFADASIKNTFRRMMESNYPDSKLFDRMRKNEAFAKSKFSKDVYDKKIDTESKYGGLDDLYRSNKKFKRFIDNLERLPKTMKKPTVRLKGIFVTIVLGLGTYALLESFARQAKELAGCWRVYVSRSGEISACKINHCSCAYKECRPENACAKLPKITDIGETCRGWPDPIKDAEGAECRKCDTNAPETSPQYLSSEEMVDPRDVYVCRPRPSVGALLSEFIADLPKQIWDGVNMTVDLLADIFKYGGILLLGGIIVAVILKISEWYRRVRNAVAKGDEEKDGLIENEHL